LYIAGYKVLLTKVSWFVIGCRVGFPDDPLAPNFLPFTLLCPLLPSPFVRASLSTSTLADFFCQHITTQDVVTYCQTLFITEANVAKSKKNNSIRT